MASNLERIIELFEELNRKLDAFEAHPGTCSQGVRLDAPYEVHRAHGCPEATGCEEDEGDSVAGFRIVSDPSIPSGEIHLRTLQDGRPVVHKITGITRLPGTGDDDGE